MTKFQAVSRLLQFITPTLLVLLGWDYVGADTAKTQALNEMRSQLVAMSIQIARLEEQGGGNRANQALIDAEQNRRIDRLEALRLGSPG